MWSMLVRMIDIGTADASPEHPTIVKVAPATPVASRVAEVLLQATPSIVALKSPSPLQPAGLPPQPTIKAIAARRRTARIVIGEALLKWSEKSIRAGFSGPALPTGAEHPSAGPPTCRRGNARIESRITSHSRHR